MSNHTTIDNLNKALQMEMTASHQYQLHAHVLDDWGLDKLAAKMREEQAEEIGHSDMFIERILFLKGDPEIAFANAPKRASNLKEMFKADLADEEEAVEFYLKAARQAYDENDVGSRTLFETIALGEEGHKAWLELQLELLTRLGEQAYSATLVSSPVIGGETA
ncbi:bacterioferritin [Octadecabacter temperatus]|uniref:Bacterioferritin n=1 Tax=Octadecabacter temperatus TaxID=1458307 RepID=A0A0K0Y8I5_9RHOB|nr:bacterioferritin [Octadecabacter temperatus]AKS47215.1 Bacterioferritin [Octadecabacter temperatus]SIO45209.1 bacterioferritin [Octadecabacter temperatus]